MEQDEEEAVDGPVPRNFRIGAKLLARFERTEGCPGCDSALGFARKGAFREHTPECRLRIAQQYAETEEGKKRIEEAKIRKVVHRRRMMEGDEEEGQSRPQKNSGQREEEVDSSGDERLRASERRLRVTRSARRDADRLSGYQRPAPEGETEEQKVKRRRFESQIQRSQAAEAREDLDVDMGPNASPEPEERPRDNDHGNETAVGSARGRQPDGDDDDDDGVLTGLHL